MADGSERIRANLLRRLAARIQAGDREPVGGQAAADRRADPARAAGHDGDPGGARRLGPGHTTSATVRVSRIAAQKDR